MRLITLPIFLAFLLLLSLKKGQTPVKTEAQSKAA
jgi:hypothetical protein